MTAEKGIDVLIKKGDGATSETFTTIGGLRDSTLTISNSPPDGTNKDSGGVTELVSGKTNLSITVSGAGVFTDNAQVAAVRTDMLAGSAGNYQFVVPGTSNGGTYEGSFVITEFEEAGTFDDVTTYSVTFASAGGGSGTGDVAFT